MSEELTTYTAKLVELHQVAPDYIVFSVTKPAGFTWQVGQYVRVGLPESDFDGKQLRALSIVSLPDDDTIMFATRTKGNPSPYKQALLATKPQTAVTLAGPLGDFTLPAHPSKLVFFAGGVGVTPVRALLAELAAHHSDATIELIYSSADTYLFLDDFKHYQSHLANMTLTQTTDVASTQAALTQAATKFGNDAQYFLSSSPAIVKSVSELLENKGVAADNLHHDMLYGYKAEA